MIEQEEIQLQIQAAKIENNYGLQQEEKKELIRSLRQSRTTGTDSSLKVITTIANTMIGSTMIVYPVLFIRDGLVSSVLVMIAIGIIQYITCRILVIHFRPDEPDFGTSIKRILGNRAFQFNIAVNIVILFFVSISYFLLIVQNFYQITQALVQAFTGFHLPNSSEIHFQCYSIQWATIICMAMSGVLLFKQNLDLLLKFLKLSVYFVMLYGLFLLASLIRNLVEVNINFSKFLFDPDFSSVAGAFALSFAIHPVASPILKKSINPKNTQKELLFGYLLTAAIYFFIGVGGCLSCAASIDDIAEFPTKYQTIFDCITTKETNQEKAFFIISKIVQLCIFLQNFSVFPFINFLGRKELMTIVGQNNKRLAFKIYTVLLIVLATLISIMNIDVSMIISLNGAIMGFFMAYGIPIYMHMKCYFSTLSQKEIEARKSLLSSEEIIMDVDDDIAKSMLACNPHEAKSLKWHALFYGLLLLIGVTLGIFKLYAFFHQFS